MICKYCGAEIAPGKNHCGRKTCIKQEIAEQVITMTPGQTLATLALLSYDHPGQVKPIPRSEGEEAIAILREKLSQVPGCAQDTEKAVEWLNKCMELAEEVRV